MRIRYFCMRVHTVDPDLQSHPKEFGRVCTVFDSREISGRGETIQGYKDIYWPVTLKYAQEFVLVTFRSYSTLTNRHDVAISRA